MKVMITFLLMKGSIFLDSIMKLTNLHNIVKRKLSYGFLRDHVHTASSMRNFFHTLYYVVQG